MSIQIYNIQTSSGEISSFGDQLDFLSEPERKEFNKIGYTGKNSAGDQTNFYSYLNSLNKGEFEIQKTKHDNGDFREKYTIVRVV